MLLITIIEKITTMLHNHDNNRRNIYYYYQEYSISNIKTTEVHRNEPCYH